MPQYDQLSGGHLMGHVGSKMNYQAWMSPSSPAGCWSHLRYEVLEAEDGRPSARDDGTFLSIFVLHYPFHPCIQEEHKLQGSCWLRSWYICFPFVELLQNVKHQSKYKCLSKPYIYDISVLKRLYAQNRCMQLMFFQNLLPNQLLFYFKYQLHHNTFFVLCLSIQF